MEVMKYIRDRESVNVIVTELSEGKVSLLLP